MATKPAAMEQRTVTRRLTSRYVLALAAIAVLAVLGQLVVQVALAQQADDARVISLAALQRTLSQQMSKAALAIMVTSDAQVRSTYISELRSVLDQWQHTHLALQNGDASLGLPGHNSPEVTALFARIEPSFSRMLDAATLLLVTLDSMPPVPLPSSPSLPTLVAPYVHTMLLAEPSFSSGMDDIVAEYQREAEQRVFRLQAIEWALLGVSLAVVVVLGAAVFRPVTRQVGKSVADLVQAQEREHELATLKDQFIIDVNHELRTPIMALYNYLEVLDSLGKRGNQELRAQILQRALTSGDAVLRLVTNILDTSTLEGQVPHLDLQPVVVAPIVREVLQTFDPREIGEPDGSLGEQEARPVSMHIPSELMVWADEGRLRQILVNLFANALKYSAPGMPIEVTASIPPSSPSALAHQRWARGAKTSQTPGVEQVQFNVRDRGLGVPPDDIPKLFNRFVRLERDIAGPTRGTGVGLYMCRVLVEAMGGRIWVESSGVSGEGSTFSFTLPTVPRAPALLPNGASEASRPLLSIGDPASA